MFRKFIYWFSLLALLVIAGGYGFLRTKLPQRSGEIILPGLNNKVDVVFDKWAIPHIEAENELDAYLALGYLHAQDRIFQMELMIRVAQGRLSETLGEVILDYLLRSSKETDAFGLQYANNKNQSKGSSG